MKEPKMRRVTAIVYDYSVNRVDLVEVMASTRYDKVKATYKVDAQAARDYAWTRLAEKDIPTEDKEISGYIIANQDDTSRKGQITWAEAVEVTSSDDIVTL